MREKLTEPFTWEKYSKRARQKISFARCNGSFCEEDATSRNLRYVHSTAGDMKKGAQIALHVLVDREDGIFVDMRYEVFGPSVLVAALEGCVDLVVGKNYDQAKRLKRELIDKHLRDEAENQALPIEADPYINLVLSCLETICSQCTDIALAQEALVTPIPEHLLDDSGIDPLWPDRSQEEKLAIVKHVMERDVQPYVEMDEGGVSVLRLEHGHHVVIAYSGNCDGCYSSTGATLSSIQSILRAKVHPSIEVIPEL